MRFLTFKHIFFLSLFLCISFSFCSWSLLLFGQFAAPCYTPEGISGQCISVYQCPNVLAQFQGRLSPTTTYYLRLLQCESGVGQYPHVCCIAPTIPQQQVRSRTRSASTRLTPLNRQSSGAGNVLPTYGMCGLTALSQRIIGGDDTQLDDYPWMAILEYQSRTLKFFRILFCFHFLIFERCSRADNFVCVFLIVKLCKMWCWRCHDRNAIVRMDDDDDVAGATA